MSIDKAPRQTLKYLRGQVVELQQELRVAETMLPVKDGVVMTKAAAVAEAEAATTAAFAEIERLAGKLMHARCAHADAKSTESTVDRKYMKIKRLKHNLSYTQKQVLDKEKKSEERAAKRARSAAAAE